jgi:hypothetical protein
MLYQIHPLLAPFTSYMATQTRTMRLAVYILHINIMTVIMYMYFTITYRFEEEQTQFEDVMDGGDINAIVKASFWASLFLLPFLSEPLSGFFGDTYEVEADLVVVIKKRRSLMRAVLYLMTLLSTLMFPVGAIVISNAIPLKYQYCVAACIPITIVGSACFNFLYLAFVNCVAKSLAKKGENKGESYGYSDAVKRFGCMIVPKKAQ